MVIERASIADARADIGDEVVIDPADGVQRTLRVTGVAYDPGKVNPGLSGGQLSGYVTLETLASLGQPEALTELHVVTAEKADDLEQGEMVAGLTRDEVLEPAGVAVLRIAVQDTPRYHSAILLDALILIFGLLGGLILLLGVLLVVNTASALLSQQIRQIGVMKAIGGRRRQIVVLYIRLVTLYGGLSIIIAMPLAALGAWQFASFFARLLNVDLQGPWLPPSVIAIEVGLALGVPLLAALIPVMRGTGMTVREALTSYGLTDNPGRIGLLDWVVSRMRGLSRPVVLSLRNTFRRRGRLALTLATLTLGGALFASVTTIQSSLDRTLDEVIHYFDYDIELNLQQSEMITTAVSDAAQLSGVEHAEPWIATNASRVRPDGTQNSNIWMMAAPASSEQIDPVLIEGRWLRPGESEALVINVDFQRDEPDIGVGDPVVLKVEGNELRWPVVGIVTSQLMGPVVFAPYEPFNEALGMAGQANRIVLETTEHVAAAQLEVAQLAEQQLRAGSLPVAEVYTRSERLDRTQGTFDILMILLTVVGGLLVAVGSIGLTGAMSLNVLERTREIGVMRAIGASNRAVARIVITEGLAIGLLSWLLGGLLAVPLSWALSSAIGTAFVQAPLAYAFSTNGVLLWLALVVVLSVLASLLPARAAWRLSVRDVLAYE